MIQRIKVSNASMLLIYTVYNIDSEKKKTLSWMRDVIRMANEGEPISTSFISNIDNEIPAEECSHISVQSMEILDRIEQDIRSHYMDNLTLNQLADKYYMNSAYLGQLFIQRYYVTFNEYLTIQRMETTAQLLSTTNYSIHEISILTGLSSAQYFIRVFRKYYGITPLQYRKSFR